MPDPTKPTWEPLPGTSDVFTLEKVLDSGWSLRSVAVRLEGGGLALVSPVRGTVKATEAWLREQGGVRYLLAPNHFHHMGIPPALDLFPDAHVVASRTAGPRLARQLDRSIEDLDGLAGALPKKVTLLEPPGIKAGEVWVRAETDIGVAWAVCDAFFNVTRPIKGMFGIGVRVMGIANGLAIGRTFKLLALADKKAYRSWVLDSIETDPPSVLVPAHGSVLEDAALGEKMRALTEKRL